MNLLAECEGAVKIAISSHIRPDGDAITSCMAIYYYLQKKMPGAQVKVLLEKPAAVFEELKQIEEIDSTFEGEDIFDVFIVVDTVKDRLGDAEKFFDTAIKTINIDHHISNSAGCGDVNLVIPTASSTAEVIFELLGEEEMDTDIAKALYIGIIHDCGVFQYSNTTSRTLEVASKLVAFDFDFSRLIEESFYQKTYVQNQILGLALVESIRFLNERCIVSSIDRKAMEFYGVTPKDLDGIVNQLRNTKGVACAIFLYEIEEMEYKVSMRSDECVDVAAIASYFGGGGHIRAAGCTMKGTRKEIIDRLSLHIQKQLEIKENRI